MNKFMEVAFEEARKGMHGNEGGPFGAVVVKNGEIISRAHNEVLLHNDPTNHAEVLAIRRASSVLENFDLTGCEIYSTSYPCPMCLASILWAHIDKIYYGTSSEEVEKVGFDDSLIYQKLCNKHQLASAIKPIDSEDCRELLLEWDKKEDKKTY
ncbi:tRNA(Arg) A34 adenosine deaminase TadA [Methanohalophilus levihalophilus]|uniref:nucleoside deaminase n=1 Tax=Methanohalophilus levihalophilus TaxID=1431282 RepID=UPI001AE72114|nr:nucleoside deaminase [Methanohalophilus levihalophilus]MBP2029326.1 tRNA(Arg) A34 adenosine deaminase TadA [Methanohalophilus levihalophilus]